MAKKPTDRSPPKPAPGVATPAAGSGKPAPASRVPPPAAPPVMPPSPAGPAITVPADAKPIAPTPSAPRPVEPNAVVTQPPVAKPVDTRPVETKPVPAMTSADVLRLRERLDDVLRGKVDAAPAGDPVLTMVAERLAAARAVDQQRIAALERAVAAAEIESKTMIEGLRSSLGAALAATEVSLTELSSARAEQATLKDALQRAAKVLARAEARIAELEEKPADDASQPVGAEAFAELMDRFVTSLSGRMGNLSLAGGEIVLKTAVAPTGSGARFVLPSATGKVPAVLHELRLRLDPKS